MNAAFQSVPTQQAQQSRQPVVNQGIPPVINQSVMAQQQQQPQSVMHQSMPMAQQQFSNMPIRSVPLSQQQPPPPQQGGFSQFPPNFNPGGNVVAPLDEWFYLDPQQNIQGPFKGKEMKEWLDAGYFKLDLPIAFGRGNKNFIPLGVGGKV